MSAQNRLDEFRHFVELHDLRPSTREAYLSYVVLIDRHFTCDPATLDEAKVRDDFLFLRKERNYAPSSIALTLAALRTFYREHLGTGREWQLWQELKVRRLEPLPTVLVRRMVTLINSARGHIARARCCVAIRAATDGHRGR